MLYRYSLDFRLWCSDIAMIVNEQGQLENLQLSQSQEAFLGPILQVLYVHKRPARFIIGKSRQSYASTLLRHLSFWMRFFSTDPVRHAVVADVFPTTKKLMTMDDVCARNLPEGWEREISMNWSEKRQKFSDSDALLFGYTAERDKSGVGGTIQMAHFSETALYKSGDELMRAILQSLPLEPMTLDVQETTGRGHDPYFYPKFHTAMEYFEEKCRYYGAQDAFDLVLNTSGWGDTVDRDGRTHPNGWSDGSYIPLFLPFTVMSKYRMDPANIGLTMSKVTKQEAAWLDAGTMDLQQIAWRRFKIRNDFGGRKEYEDDDPGVSRFQQEYPITWREMFETTSRSVFDKVTISKYLRHAEGLQRRRYEVQPAVGSRPAVTRPILMPVDLRWSRLPRFDPSTGFCVNREEIAVEAHQAAYSDTLIYRTPDRNPDVHNRYKVGLDIAEGLEQGDYSVLFVWDEYLKAFVLLHRSHLPPVEFGQFAAKVAIYYNAWTMGEYNMHGAAVLREYQRFTFKACPRPGMHNGRFDATPDAYWFFSTANRETGKGYIVGLLDSFIRSNPQGMPFKVFWSEADVFERDKRGRMGAANKRVNPGVKNYDDALIAAGQALLAVEHSPRMVVLNQRPRNFSEIDVSGANFNAYNKQRMPAAGITVPQGCRAEMVL